MATRKHKYGAVKTVVDGITFDSKMEAKRYGQLKQLESAGEISGLELQPVYHIVINGVKVCKAIMDFRYKCHRTGVACVEDVKGMDNDTSRLKRKLVLAVHGVKTIVVDRV